MTGCDKKTDNTIKLWVMSDGSPSEVSEKGLYTYILTHAHGRECTVECLTTIFRRGKLMKELNHVTGCFLREIERGGRAVSASDGDS